MKSLGRTIDRVLEVMPKLEDDLVRIRRKWKRYPRKEMDYWKEFLDILNSGFIKGDQKWEEIRKIVIANRKLPPKKYTFQEAHPNDRVLGVIPEYIADKIKKYDRRCIELAKKQMEASMTQDMILLQKLSRQAYKLELDQKKIWLDIRDHFELWGDGHRFVVKTRNSIPVLIIESSVPHHSLNPPIANIMLDRNSLLNILRHLGIEPPSGLMDNG